MFDVQFHKSLLCYLILFMFIMSLSRYYKYQNKIVVEINQVLFISIIDFVWWKNGINPGLVVTTFFSVSAESQLHSYLSDNFFFMKFSVIEKFDLNGWILWVISCAILLLPVVFLELL